jgi:hypothetical protein
MRDLTNEADAVVARERIAGSNLASSEFLEAPLPKTKQ